MDDDAAEKLMAEMDLSEEDRRWHRAMRADLAVAARLEKFREQQRFLVSLMPDHLVSTERAEQEIADLEAAGKTDAEVEHALFGVYERDLFAALDAHLAERRIPRGLLAMFEAMRFGGDRGREAGRVAGNEKIAQAHGFGRGITNWMLAQAGVTADEEMQ